MKETTDTSQAPSRLARSTPLRHPPVVKPAPQPSKPARIPVKPLVPTISESTETVPARAKTPRQFSPAFICFIDKLKELNWFEEQYPSVDVAVCSILIHI